MTRRPLPLAAEPVAGTTRMGDGWWRYFYALDQMFKVGIELPQLTIATLPTSPADGRLVWVTDASPDPCAAVSVGGQWLKLKTDGVVS